MITELKKALNDGKSVLFVGPMSKNLVDAAIKFVYDFKTFLPLIASRRQIDYTGGYVNNWTTGEYVKYVKERDKENRIILCRDHGGPNQGSLQFIDIQDAMQDAINSFYIDVELGFNIIHIDTVKVLDFYKDDNIMLNDSKILEALFMLYLICNKHAKTKNKEIEFEIGMESSDGTQMDLTSFGIFLKKSIERFTEHNLPMPLFCVAQTGTHVKETRNMGEMLAGLTDLLIGIKNFYPNIYLKEHNADYLTIENLKLHKTLGIQALNIAPEFGYSETMFLIDKMFKTYSIDLYRKFLRLAYDSKKWERWIVNDKLQDEAKAIIAGHYVFSKPECIEIKEELSKKLEYNVDEEIVKHLSNKLLKYYIDLEII